MTDSSLPRPSLPRPSVMASLRPLFKTWGVWGASAVILAVLALLDPAQAQASLGFVAAALAKVGPFLVLSVAFAAWASATGADHLIARAFTGKPAVMILMGALVGALSPFCSCGVIPLVAALLAIGVPLPAVMAFWLASPLMDPTMFLLTTGVLGMEFAVAKTLVAVGLGLFGGAVTHLLAGSALLDQPLREGIGNGGCGGSRIRAPKPVVWVFWKDAARTQKFATESRKTGLFLLKWLLLAFVLESLMVAYIPAATITGALGGDGIMPIALATIIGVPAYLNGYAALPLVGGLIGQGMSPGAGMAFLVAGGVTSIPAAMAVWALVRPKVFALYLGFSLSGALMAGLAFQVWAGM